MHFHGWRTQIIAGVPAIPKSLKGLVVTCLFAEDGFWYLLNAMRGAVEMW